MCKGIGHVDLSRITMHQYEFSSVYSLTGDILNTTNCLCKRFVNYCIVDLLELVFCVGWLGKVAGDFEPENTVVNTPMNQSLEFAD